MQLRLGLALALSALSLAGCSSLAFKNGTLDYKSTTDLSPLQYPEGSMVRPATPLYPAPAVDPLAIEHPQLVTDGNQNPLLKIDGNSATIWQYTLAALSSLNHTVVGQSKNSYEVTVKVDQQTYVLRLSSAGSSNTLAVFNADSSFADKEKAADLLAQIYQNWPA